ncbi:hypothetical protein LTR96_011315 [Exophiala xenobiotica]|nr:hypothetical protein LTR41_011192 [Exophiala xenobiotica]KAK5215362.1 hypothetical protein LTR72_011584 [Exophiala xenobiotica]KAK5220367.1 hypothetical protein LTR47_011200 [Exophiala xenobiotica]KAK5244574.1 hypothetical protein LTS06_009872 [Exophiala xenobiotica]KAK5263266.1 hypothetical protein LTR96_011315 [Exophiala xenobiotica]
MGPLIFATGGGCPRATEVGSALWCNTQTSMRSYYVAMRSFLWVADYSKTERRTGAPRVIARFYPRKVGQMMIAYLSEIRPSYQLLCSICERQDESIFSDLFWHTDGKAWTAENFTPAFKETTKMYLGHELGTADWRHIHVALQQEILKLETEDEEVTSFALQNGHTKEVEDLHYALSVDMLRGLDERVMTTFLQNSQKWHRFLGLEEIKPTSNPRKRGISDKTMSAIEGLQQTMTRIEASVSQLEANTSVENVSKRPRLGDDKGTISPSEGDTWAEIRRRLHRWYPGFHWRSTGHLEAVEALVYGPRENDVIVQLPTGAGKSILIEISAYLDPGKTVIVVVPYRSLRDAFVDALRRKGIPTDDFRSDGWGATQVVVIVLETWKVDHRFQQFVDDQATKGRLSRIIYDEAHLAVLEGSNGFRPWADVLAAQPRGVQRIFMSATLPREVRQYLIQMATIRETNLTMIQQSGNVPGIQWVVKEYEQDELLSLLEELTSCHAKCLIYVKTLNTGRQIAEAMGWAFYQGATSDEEAADILQTFECSVTGTLVATTALGAGMNLTVDSIICLGGGYDAITVAQQAGRLKKSQYAKRLQ